MSYMNNFRYNSHNTAFPSRYSTYETININPSCPYLSLPGDVRQEIIYNNQVKGNIGYTVNYDSQRTYNTLQQAYPFSGQPILKPLP